MDFSTFFTPFSTVIQNISNANPAVVTTTTDNDYDATMLVRIVYPPNSHFGMDEVNGRVFQVVPLTSNSFSLADPETMQSIDSTSFGVFTLLPNKQRAQVIPVSEKTALFIAAEKNNKNITPEL